MVILHNRETMKPGGYAAALIIGALIALVLFFAIMVYPQDRELMLRGKVIIHINDDYFPNVEVKRGTTIVFVNDGIKIHRLVSPYFNFELDPGETYEYKAMKVGQFEYYCSYHPWERGTITVKA